MPHPIEAIIREAYAAFGRDSARFMAPGVLRRTDKYLRALFRERKEDHAMQKTTFLAFAAATLAAFLAGHWSNSSTGVRAASTDSPAIQVQSIRGDTSLTVYYPSLNKL